MIVYPVGRFGDMEAQQTECQCCGRKLRTKARWLELDQRTNAYHDRGDVPPDLSQGWFPFGLACARRKLAEAGE